MVSVRLSRLLSQAQAIVHEMRFINDAVLAGINDMDSRYVLSDYAPLIRAQLAELDKVLADAETTR